MFRAFLLVSLVMLATLSFAQTPTGTFEGVVQDQQGAVLAGATVTVTSVSTRIEKKATTDSQGRYLMPFVLPGNYNVTVAATGFRSEAQNDGPVLSMIFR